MSPREEDGEDAGEGLDDVLDNESMSSTTVLSKLLFKRTTVTGELAKKHLARAVEAYNTAIGIQDKASGGDGQVLENDTMQVGSITMHDASINALRSDRTMCR